MSDENGKPSLWWWNQWRGRLLLTWRTSGDGRNDWLTVTLFVVDMMIIYSIDGNYYWKWPWKLLLSVLLVMLKLTIILRWWPLLMMMMKLYEANVPDHYWSVYVPSRPYRWSLTWWADDCGKLMKMVLSHGDYEHWVITSDRWYWWWSDELVLSDSVMKASIECSDLTCYYWPDYCDWFLSTMMKAVIFGSDMTLFIHWRANQYWALRWVF